MRAEAKIAAEREACAQLCADVARNTPVGGDIADDCAERIRARRVT
jgi:hypothetical protein